MPRRSANAIPAMKKSQLAAGTAVEKPRSHGENKRPMPTTSVTQSCHFIAIGLAIDQALRACIAAGRDPRRVPTRARTPTRVARQPATRAGTTARTAAQFRSRKRSRAVGEAPPMAQMTAAAIGAGTSRPPWRGAIRPAATRRRGGPRRRGCCRCGRQRAYPSLPRRPGHRSVRASDAGCGKRCVAPVPSSTISGACASSAARSSAPRSAKPPGATPGCTVSGVSTRFCRCSTSLTRTQPGPVPVTPLRDAALQVKLHLRCAIIVAGTHRRRRPATARHAWCIAISAGFGENCSRLLPPALRSSPSPPAASTSLGRFRALT